MWTVLYQLGVWQVCCFISFVCLWCIAGDSGRAGLFSYRYLLVLGFEFFFSHIFERGFTEKESHPLPFCSTPFSTCFTIDHMIPHPHWVTRWLIKHHRFAPRQWTSVYVVPIPTVQHGRKQKIPYNYPTKRQEQKIEDFPLLLYIKALYIATCVHK